MGSTATLFTPPPAPSRSPRDRVLYVGRLLPHKGIDRLIDALPPDLPLTVCGRPYHRDYSATSSQLAGGKRVEFVTDADDADDPRPLPPCLGQRPPLGLPRLLREHLRGARADGLHAAGGDGLRHAGDLLAGRRRCPSSSATARPGSSSTPATS